MKILARGWVKVNGHWYKNGDVFDAEPEKVKGLTNVVILETPAEVAEETVETAVSEATESDTVIKPIEEEKPVEKPKRGRKKKAES